MVIGWDPDVDKLFSALPRVTTIFKNKKLINAFKAVITQQI